MFDLQAIQAALTRERVDGWLLYDFRGSNVLARRVLDLEQRPAGSRRFFYFVPTHGEPKKLVHRIEAAALDHLPGSKRVYLRWHDLEQGIGKLVAGCSRVAMEYAPRTSNPYISRVDAGTVELVRSQGIEVVSSGDLIQQFEAAWTDEQWQMHQEAARWTDAAYGHAFGLIASRIRGMGQVRESEVQQAILAFFAEHGLTTYSPPIVAVGRHSGDPHYENKPETDVPIQRGDFVLIDLWAKLDRPRAVYSDLTRVGFVGEDVPSQYREVFDVVARARDAAISLVRSAFSHHQALAGWQVDRAARNVIEAAGYGEKFVHRTGHSIGEETHGNGANMDDLETHDERKLLPRTCFSIEPGIYLDEFGVRSEVNVYIDAQRNVHVTGGTPQQHVLAILKEC